MRKSPSPPSTWTHSGGLDLAKKAGSSGTYRGCEGPPSEAKDEEDPGPHGAGNPAGRRQAEVREASLCSSSGAPEPSKLLGVGACSVPGRERRGSRFHSVWAQS